MVKKKTKSHINLFGKQIPFWPLAFGLFIAVVLSVISYNLYLDYQDRQKFNDIEYTVDTLVDRIGEGFDVTSVDSSNRCYKAGRKFEAEPTICVYSYSFNVRDVEFSDLSSYLESQKDIVENYSHFRSSITDFRARAHNGSCSLKYEKNSNTSYEVECSSYARDYYYEFTD